ncbi:MAG: GcrA cell cycle regulator [Rhodobiaceae bacterium]|nr:GcrA cell cycle regulator [Rhodobiaceae bacterium]MCC0054940.1 GcrA cell cycle regulator [Rhodobiaceae bacterium]
MSWTDERVEMLKKLWAEGLSASQIAAKLGDVTRNAVIGKVHRLGLSGRMKTVRTSQPRPRRQRQPSPPRRPTVIGNTALKAHVDAVAEPVIRPRPAVVQELVIPPSERLSILQLSEYTCKWPIGDPSAEDFHFCGRKSQTTGPYCEHHASVAYQPASDRRRKKSSDAG